MDQVLDCQRDISLQWWRFRHRQKTLSKTFACYYGVQLREKTGNDDPSWFLQKKGLLYGLSKRDAVSRNFD